MKGAGVSGMADDPIGDRAGDQVGDLAGDLAGDQAGDQAGDLASDPAGDPAGDSIADRTGEPTGAVVARVLHPGSGSGRTSAIAPVSFWGGVGVDGTVADVHHPAHGESLVGRALVLESSKGSSSGSSVLAELIVSGHAPALIVVSEPDAVIVSGCLAASEISGVLLPVVQVTRPDLVLLGESPDLSVDCAQTPIGELTRVAMRQG